MTDLNQCADTLRNLLPAPLDAVVPPPSPGAVDGGAGKPLITVLLLDAAIALGLWAVH